MSWIGVIVGVGGSLLGAKISGDASKDAAKTAAEGSERAIEFQEDTRDIALALGAPQREAGYSALDKMGEMTGLIDTGGSFGRPLPTNGSISAPGGGSWDDRDWQLGWDPENKRYTAVGAGGQQLHWDAGANNWMTNKGSAYRSRPAGNVGQRAAPSGPVHKGFAPSGGGRTIYKNRAFGGALYNVNELGPENIYSNGKVTRTDMPKTMPEDPHGYVKPHGRFVGGPMNTAIDGAAMRVAARKGFGGRGGNASYLPNTTGDVIYDENGRPYDNQAFTNKLENSGYTNAATNQASSNAPTNGEYPTPVENPYSIETDPGYQFRLNEGMRALEGSAAARGGLLSGGFGRKAIRYGQEYASNEYTNIYNRLSNIAGMGQVSANQGGVFAMNSGANMGNAAQAGAVSSAYGQQAAGNAWAGAINEIAQLPWDEAIKKD